MAKQTKMSREQRITLAQLQIIEGTYTGFKASFENMKVEAKASKEKYNKLALEVNELIAEIDEEENDTTRQALRVELAKKKKELEELDTETAIKHATKMQLKKHIDNSIDEIKELPGVREAINELMLKKYNKEIEKLKDKNENIGKEKKNIDKISELIDEDKTENALEISDSFKNMLDAKNEIKKIERELARVDSQLQANPADPAQQASLQQRQADLNKSLVGAKTKYQNAKTKFMTLAKDADSEFKDAEIDDLTTKINDGIQRRPNRENDYNLEKALQKQSQKLTKQGLMIKEQMFAYEEGKEAVERTSQYSQQQPQGQAEQDQEGEEKLHWWNFIKKYKRAKQKRLDTGREDDQNQRPQDDQQAPQQENNEKAHKAFVKELQRNATIESIVNREMRETKDRVADIGNNYEKEDRD